MFEILLLVATKMKDLSWGDLISGYEVNPTRFSYDPNQVIFNFFFFIRLNRRQKKFAL